MSTSTAKNGQDESRFRAAVGRADEACAEPFAIPAAFDGDCVIVARSAATTDAAQGRRTPDRKVEATMAAIAQDGFRDIGSVAREIGVATSTLRSWERRYRVVVPQRSRGGQRLYDAEQVRVLRLIQAQIRDGVRAGVAHRTINWAAPLRTRRVELPATPEAPGLARRAVDEVLEAVGNERLGFMVRLVASELVTNALVHGRPRNAISLELALLDGWVRVRVENAGSRFSLSSIRARRRADSGRGLHIVDAVADEWTIASGVSATTIEVRVRVPAA